MIDCATIKKQEKRIYFKFIQPDTSQSNKDSLMSNKLEQLRKLTTVVADTGDIEAIKLFQPQDATTNPSLLLKAAQLPQYKILVKEAASWSKQKGGNQQEQMNNAADKLAVNIGCEILNIIPGYISTEVDARLSFDTIATVNRARKLIHLYEQNGIARNRVLIKVAATWEGIRAVEILQLESINCNLTLIFSFTQALASAQANCFLISPFVGRIMDWHKQAAGCEDFAPHEDPGVLSVQKIYNHFKSNHYSTVVMGASFRNTGEIEHLAGCDRLTISPQLMESLSQDNSPLSAALSVEQALKSPQTQNNATLEQHTFRWEMNENAMATEKLAEGIRNFTSDQIKLEEILSALVN